VLQASEVIAFVGSADLRQARAFYEQALGLRVIEHNDFACVFDANGTMLRVTAVAQVDSPGYTVLGWRVSDIAAAARGLAAKGVVFLRHDGIDQDESGRQGHGAGPDRVPRWQPGRLDQHGTARGLPETAALPGHEAGGGHRFGCP
jgi:catechol 2,3-dioxygenase-like lactoylglutathione lyase family enzyme